MKSWISQGRLILPYQWGTFHGPAIFQIPITASRQNRGDTENIGKEGRVCDDKLVERYQKCQDNKIRYILDIF